MYEPTHPCPVLFSPLAIVLQLFGSRLLLLRVVDIITLYLDTETLSEMMQCSDSLSVDVGIIEATFLQDRCIGLGKVSHIACAC